jgi:hypothetical protein
MACVPWITGRHRSLRCKLNVFVRVCLGHKLACLSLLLFWNILYIIYGYSLIQHINYVIYYASRTFLSFEKTSSKHIDKIFTLGNLYHWREIGNKNIWYRIYILIFKHYLLSHLRLKFPRISTYKTYRRENWWCKCRVQRSLSLQTPLILFSSPVSLCEASLRTWFGANWSEIPSGKVI